MTTCTWDGKRISADTRSITGAVIDQAPCQKIFQKKGIYCAIAGDVATALIVMEYLLKDKRKAERPELDAEDIFQIMLVSKDRCEYYSCSLDPSPMAAPCAIGSGGDYALAAMLCGKSGPQSIQVAAKMDPYTGVEFGIRTYKIR